MSPNFFYLEQQAKIDQLAVVMMENDFDKACGVEQFPASDMKPNMERKKLDSEKNPTSQTII